MDKKDKKSSSDAGPEPKPGEGVRSLDTWRKLARARADLASREAAGERGPADPSEYFQRFGLADLAPGASSDMLRDLEGRLGAVDEFDELRIDARRGAVAVVKVPALAVAVTKAVAANFNAAANLNLAANLNAGANVNFGANVQVQANLTQNTNWVTGFGTPE